MKGWTRFLALLAFSSAAPAIAQSCHQLDSEQAGINASFSNLRASYPAATGSWRSCMSNARTPAAEGACATAAFLIANSCPFSSCNWSGPDWLMRLTGILARQASVEGERQRLGCRAGVRQNILY